MVREYALIEMCALIRERFIAPPTIGTAHLSIKAYQYAIMMYCHCGYYPHHLRTQYLEKKLETKDSKMLED